ncbi:MAG: acyltransferase [Actinophytocola sp.]
MARTVPLRLPSLTGTRFVAAVLVFLFHATVLFPFASPGAQKSATTLFATAGWTGVTFFFVLSGFVLTWAVRPGDTAPQFWRRRFFKIYPNHLLTFLAALILLTGVTKATIHGWDSVLNVLLLQSWDPDLSVRTGFNVVAWSLSCEALFYFCFPFLIRLVDKVRPERLWFWTILSAASVISLPTFAKLLPAGQQFPYGFSDWELWFVFHFPPTQMLTFVFGIFMAKIVLTGRRLPVSFGGAVALTVVAYFVTPLFGPLYQFSAVMLVPIGLLVATTAAADAGSQPMFLGSRKMVWLGDISFAFYMWHVLVITYGHHLLGAGENWSTSTAIAVMVLLFAATLALSWATFRFVERPLMRRFATSRRRRELAAVTAGSTSVHSDRDA